MTQLSKKEQLFLFYVGLFCTGLIIVSFAWNANKFYTSAYTPVVQQAIERRAEIEAYKKAHGESSNEPRAAGFKESDMDKQQGDRYSTY
jgi:hypothetical protein